MQLTSDAYEDTVKLIARAENTTISESSRPSLVGGERLEITTSDVIARDTRRFN